MKKLQLACLAAIVAVLFAAAAFAAEDGKSDDGRWGFNLGLGGTFSTSEYRGVERLGTALPILGYEGDRLYLRGLSGGMMRSFYSLVITLCRLGLSARAHTRSQARARVSARADFSSVSARPRTMACVTRGLKGISPTRA